MSNTYQKSTGIKNIIYIESVDRYRVDITRKRKKFYRTTRSLESAIEAKRLALEFYEKNGRLPDNYKELNLPRVESSYEFFIRLEDLPITQICSRCRKYMTYASMSAYKTFAESGDLCHYCRKDLADLEKFQALSEEEQALKYISKYSAHSYRIDICKRGQNIRFNQRSLDEAIVSRDKILKFYDENFRLPSRNELNPVLGIKLMTEDRDPSMKYIFYRKDRSRYEVNIVRKGEKIRRSFESLEDAKVFRDLLAEFVDENKRIPTKSEVEDLVSKVNI